MAYKELFSALVPHCQRDPIKAKTLANKFLCCFDLAKNLCTIEPNKSLGEINYQVFEGQKLARVDHSMRLPLRCELFAQ
jgi:hypothetical protein